MSQENKPLYPKEILYVDKENGLQIASGQTHLFLRTNINKQETSTKLSKVNALELAKQLHEAVKHQMKK